jgi:NAD(P)-dependent dehydrogenase (short-subunit alcohol dehydrogenase family)
MPESMNTVRASERKRFGRQLALRMRRALLTGVGREGQVGAAVARRLATDGFELILVDRTAEHVQARARELVRLGHDVTGFACDLADSTAVASLFNSVDPASIGFDAVVHMAGGFALSGPVADSDLSVWNRQLTINLQTALLVAKASLPALRSKRGSLVFFASESALDGAKVSHISAYAVAKSGVVMLMRSVAQEERDSGVRANAVAPAAVRTTTNLETMGDTSRFVEREDVAAAVSYLCSDQSLAVTGQVFRLSPR